MECTGFHPEGTGVGGEKGEGLLNLPGERVTNTSVHVLQLGTIL